jgi:transcription elongation factor GreA
MAKSTANDFIELTQEGLEELKAEIEELTNVKMPAIVKRVSSAREQGDLSENADYQSARDEQGIIQARINEIEAIVVRAKIIKQSKKGNIGMGSEVKVQLKGKSNKTFSYHIVGEFESDPEEGKISSVSPLGKALVKKKKGDIVEVNAPAGKIEYKILEVK